MLKKCKGISKSTKQQCKQKLINRDYCYNHEEQDISNINGDISNINGDISNDEDKCSMIFEQKKCERPIHKNTLCEYHYVLKIRNEGKRIFMKHSGLTIKCANPNHNACGSLYERNQVPIEKFEEKNKTYKQCSNCRETAKLKIRNKRIEIIRKNEENSDPNFKICAHDEHHIHSKYPKDKVPIEMFKYDNLKDKTKMSIDCSDCRKAHSKNVMERNSKREEKAKKENKYICNKCFKTSDEPFLKKDGELSAKCDICRYKILKIAKKKRKKMKDVLKNIRLEKIMESESSCQLCKSIFLISDNEKTPFIELKTYLKNKEGNINRYVKYEKREYLAKDFLEEFKNLLELRIIELDHVPKEEQEARGMIKSGEKCIEKKRCVTECWDEHSMREEAKITQNLCSLCHCWVSKVRLDNDGNKKIYKRKTTKFVEKLKMESGGCSICGFLNPELLGYLEFDHINCKEKILAVSEMIAKNYKLEQIIEECKKCRILCRSCHKIHTDKQRDLGLFDNSK